MAFTYANETFDQFIDLKCAFKDNSFFVGNISKKSI